MKTISFLNNKGGVGKTASTAIIAHIMADSGKKVLLIDLDPQGNCSSIYSDVNIIKRLVCLLKGENPDSEKEYSAEDLFLDAELDIHSVIKKTDYENLDIIPSMLTLAECEEQLKADIRTPQQFRLKNHLDKIYDEYEYCLIDCSPSINILNINGLVASDEVYIPLKCDAWSATGMCIAMNLIKTVSTYNSRLKLKGCFFTQWESNKNVSKTTYELLTQFIPHLILPFTISKSKLIEELSYTQKPLLSIESNKNSKVAQDYMRLTNFIIDN